MTKIEQKKNHISGGADKALIEKGPNIAQTSNMKINLKIFISKVVS